MALVTAQFPGLPPWELAKLGSLQRAWYAQVAVMQVNRQNKRDQDMLEAMARIMGRKR